MPAPTSNIRSRGWGASPASSQSSAAGCPLPRQAAGMKNSGPRSAATCAVHSATVPNSAAIGSSTSLVIRVFFPDKPGQFSLDLSRELTSAG